MSEKPENDGSVGSRDHSPLVLDDNDEEKRRKEKEEEEEKKRMEEKGKEIPEATRIQEGFSSLVPT